jgi:hypothetical protein
MSRSDLKTERDVSRRVARNKILRLRIISGLSPSPHLSAERVACAGKWSKCVMADVEPVEPITDAVHLSIDMQNI